jgi:hypothetical protein
MCEMKQTGADRPCTQPSAFRIVLNGSGRTAMSFEVCATHYRPSLAAITLFLENDLTPCAFELRVTPFLSKVGPRSKVMNAA